MSTASAYALVAAEEAIATSGWVPHDKTDHDNAGKFSWLTVTHDKTDHDNASKSGWVIHDKTGVSAI